MVYTYLIVLPNQRTILFQIRNTTENYTNIIDPIFGTKSTIKHYQFSDIYFLHTIGTQNNRLQPSAPYPILNLYLFETGGNMHFYN